MKNTTLPKSKAKTAYDLLSDIAALALEEPKRIDMDVFCQRADMPSHAWKPRAGFPDCGTVGCIGGWASMLKHGKFTDEDDAAALLGLTAGQACELFYPSDLLADAAGGHAQTPAHAAAVVRHIEQFQTKHAAQLKAKAL
jgi:hypothetical protein